MDNLRLSVGTLFANRFQIERVAGSGGMGVVYQARDHYSGKPVALKLLHDGAAGPDGEERFVREAQLLSELHHQNIVAYIAHGQTAAGQRFLAMEWLEGQDLAQRLRQRPLSLDEALLVMRRAAEGLSVAHQRGIIHRDLKPTNLFLPAGEVDRLKLLDFGIARRMLTSRVMTRTGMVVGSPEYMAPEQARGARELSAAADIFSLGCVLYECLTGEPPFVAEHIAAVLVRILFEEPIDIAQRLPGLPASVAALLRDMLQKDPARRVADAVALLRRLTELGDTLAQMLSQTLAAPQAAAQAFGENEQVLFSLVVAVECVPQAALALTEPASEPALAMTQRAAILSAIRALGARADSLVDGSIVATMPQTGSARDQVTMAIRIARLIQERWSGAAVSVTTGRGTTQGATPVGDVADRAMQLLYCNRHGHPADPGASISGVWLDELSTLLLGPGFTIIRLAQGDLVIGEAREVDESRPLLGKPTPCVGRDAELSHLEAQLSSCIAESEARAILVTAPPGVGKSRLRHEFLRRVEQRSESITVLLGRGDLMSAGAPLGVLEQAVRRLCGLLGGESLQVQQQRLQERIGQHGATAADKERLTFFVGELSNIQLPAGGRPALMAARQDPKIMLPQMRQAFIDWLRAECRAAPVLLILDDLQWGDALSVGLIDETLRELRQERLLVLALGRPEMSETFPKLWQSHGPLALHLKGLSKKAGERLVHHALGTQLPPALTARLVDQSGGNALFLEELIRSAAEGRSDELPETVVAMLQARIGRLDVGARRAILAASVYGQSFWLGGVAALLGPAAAPGEFEPYLARLLENELIEPRAVSSLPGHREYGFRHALVREAAYALLGGADRETGHRLAGGFLEAAGLVDPSTFAEHFALGGALARAARAFLGAAAFAIRRNDFQSALAFAERAEALGVPEECRVELHTHRGKAYAAIAKWELARAEFQTAVTHTGPQANDRRAELLTQLTVAAYWALDIKAARLHALDALALADLLGRDDLAASIMSLQGMISTAEGDVLGGLECFRLANQRAGEQKIVALQPTLCYWLGWIDQACRDGLRVVEIAREIRDVTTLMMSLPCLGLSLAACDRYAEAVEVFAEARRIGSQHKITALLSRAISMETGWHIDVFDYQGAEAIANEAYDLAASAQYVPPMVSASLDRLFLALHRGEIEHVKAHLDPLRLLIEKAAGWHEWIWNLRLTVLRATLALARGEFQEALRLLPNVIHQAPQRRRIKYQIIGLLLQGQARIGLGQRDSALRDLGDALRLAAQTANQSLWLRVVAERLTLEEDAELRSQALVRIDALRAALPMTIMRQAFEESDTVRRLSR